jgi:glyoxylase-like metal-dependent hydrolase (beta-lactamase superfamily II)
MKITELTKRNIMFTVPENANGGFVHLGLILGKRHNFIVDTGLGESNVKAILDYIGGDKKPIIAIITHAHWDHAFGTSALKDDIIISHVLCREKMDTQWDDKFLDSLIDFEHRTFIDEKIHKCLPNLVFEGRMCFPEDGITLYHTPGHSDDSINVYDGVGKVLYTADNFGVDEGEAGFWTDYNNDASEQMIMLYKQLDFEICVPSHSEPQTREIITLLEEALAEDLNDSNEDTDA